MASADRAREPCLGIASIAKQQRGYDASGERKEKRDDEDEDAASSAYSKSLVATFLSRGTGLLGYA